MKGSGVEGLYVCIVSMLTRLRRQNLIIVENTLIETHTQIVISTFNY